MAKTINFLMNTLYRWYPTATLAVMLALFVSAFCGWIAWWIPAAFISLWFVVFIVEVSENLRSYRL